MDDRQVGCPDSYSVVLLYFRRGIEVAESLRDLTSQSVPPTEILVVDNASGDGVIETIASEFPTVRFVSASENRGYAAGMNFGLANLSKDSEWVLFLTHEVRMDRRCVQEMLAAGCARGTGRAAQETVLVGPVLRVLGESTPWSFGGILTSSGSPAHSSSIQHGQIQWIDGACMLIRRGALVSAGAFDERFFLYWEDVEISTRLAKHGALVVAAAAIAWQATGSMPIYFAVRNQLLYWRMHRDPYRSLATVLRCAAKTLRYDVLGWKRGGNLRATARWYGVSDGLTGHLRYDFLDTRERLRALRRGEGQ